MRIHSRLAPFVATLPLALAPATTPHAQPAQKPEQQPEQKPPPLQPRVVDGSGTALTGGCS